MQGAGVKTPLQPTEETSVEQVLLPVEEMSTAVSMEDMKELLAVESPHRSRFSCRNTSCGERPLKSREKHEEEGVARRNCCGLTEASTFPVPLRHLGTVHRGV